MSPVTRAMFFCSIPLKTRKIFLFGFHAIFCLRANPEEVICTEHDNHE